MDDKTRAKLRFVEQVCIPAIAEHSATGRVTRTHPVSGAPLVVTRNDEFGYIVVSTEPDGILYRVTFQP